MSSSQLFGEIKCIGEIRHQYSVKLVSRERYADGAMVTAILYLCVQDTYIFHEITVA